MRFEFCGSAVCRAAVFAPICTNTARTWCVAVRTRLLRSISIESASITDWPCHNRACFEYKALPLFEFACILSAVMFSGAASTCAWLPFAEISLDLTPPSAKISPVPCRNVIRAAVVCVLTSRSTGLRKHRALLGPPENGVLRLSVSLSFFQPHVTVQFNLRPSAACFQLLGRLFSRRGLRRTARKGSLRLHISVRRQPACLSCVGKLQPQPVRLQSGEHSGSGSRRFRPLQASRG